jgi:hypothetical protein
MPGPKWKSSNDARGRIRTLPSRGAGSTNTASLFPVSPSELFSIQSRVAFPESWGVLIHTVRFFLLAKRAENQSVQALYVRIFDRFEFARRQKTHHVNTP